MVSIVQLKAFHALYFLWNLLSKNHVSMLDPVRKGGFQAEDAAVLATFGFHKLIIYPFLSTSFVYHIVTNHLYTNSKDLGVWIFSQ